MGIHGSITGKTMMCIICFDHITTATTPLPNLYRMKRTSYNQKVIYTSTRVEVNTGIKAYSSKKSAIFGQHNA